MSLRMYVWIVVLSCFACSNSSQEENNCTYGTPRPIFSDTLEAVRQHQFEVKGQSAIENITFVTDLQVEVQQSGCEALRQEFQFILDGDYTQESSSFWLQQATLYFQFLGSVSKQHYPLYAWGQAIGEAAKNMKIGEAYEVQAHFEATIDKVASKEQATLIVILAQQLE